MTYEDVGLVEGDNVEDWLLNEIVLEELVLRIFSGKPSFTHNRNYLQRRGTSRGHRG